MCFGGGWHIGASPHPHARTHGAFPIAARGHNGFTRGSNGFTMASAVVDAAYHHRASCARSYLILASASSIPDTL
jgi:hypothetical protein